MKPEDTLLAASWLLRAEESLEEANTLITAGHLNGAVNRIYYACFYAVTALLQMEGYGSAKHSGVMSLFDKHWVKTERVPVELSRFYHQLFDRRQRADYTIVVSYKTSDVEMWLTQAQDFVRIANALLIK